MRLLVCINDDSTTTPNDFENANGYRSNPNDNGIADNDNNILPVYIYPNPNPDDDDGK